MKKFGGDHLDLYQNIEFAIVSVWRGDPSLIDIDVSDAVDALARHYHAEEAGRQPPRLRIAPRASRVFDEVRAMCEWRMGRAPFPGDPLNETPLPLPASDIVAALREIGKSITRWSKLGGRKGYLEFVSQYIR